MAVKFEKQIYDCAYDMWARGIHPTDNIANFYREAYIKECGGREDALSKIDACYRENAEKWDMEMADFFAKNPKMSLARQ